MAKDDLNANSVIKAWWQQSGCNPDHTANESLINGAIEFACDVANGKVVIIEIEKKAVK